MAESNPVEQFVEKLTASLAEGNFVRLTLSAPLPTSDTPQKILGRFIMLKGRPHLSLTLRYATRDVVKNIPTANSATWLREQVGQKFRSALLGTTQQDWQFISSEAGEARLINHKPSTKQPPSHEHDQKHAGILDDSARDWLRGLGIMDDTGKVRASMAGKHRQINRYLEILSHLAKDCGWMAKNTRQPTSNAKHSIEPRTNADTPLDVGSSMSDVGSSQLQFADMGCGKGYLTFGAWHLFHRVWKQPARILGVEARKDLVATTNKLAKQIKADGLEFVSGTIDSAKLSRADALIALHACDTATDDAIRRGIELGAKLIVVAPCCQKELRPQLGKPGPFASVLRHGVMEERMAEWLTDGLRALFLEWAGYRTKVMEFVSAEHTPKNLMIAAVREREPFADAEARKRIEELKSFFGVQHHALDPLLGATDARRL